MIFVDVLNYNKIYSTFSFFIYATFLVYQRIFFKLKIGLCILKIIIYIKLLPSNRILLQTNKWDITYK